MAYRFKQKIKVKLTCFQSFIFHTELLSEQLRHNKLELNHPLREFYMNKYSIAVVLGLGVLSSTVWSQPPVVYNMSLCVRSYANSFTVSSYAYSTSSNSFTPNPQFGSMFSDGPAQCKNISFTRIPPTPQFPFLQLDLGSVQFGGTGSNGPLKSCNLSSGLAQVPPNTVQIVITAQGNGSIPNPFRCIVEYKSSKVYKK